MAVEALLRAQECAGVSVSPPLLASHDRGRPATCRFQPCEPEPVTELWASVPQQQKVLKTGFCAL